MVVKIKNLRGSLVLLLVEQMVFIFLKSWPSTPSQSCRASALSLAPVQLKVLPCVSWTWPPCRVHVVITTCSLVVTGWMSDRGRPSGWNSLCFPRGSAVFQFAFMDHTATIYLCTLWLSVPKGPNHNTFFEVVPNLPYELWVVRSCLLVPSFPAKKNGLYHHRIISRDAGIHIWSDPPSANMMTSMIPQ